jgi:hypothetical protein
MDKDSQEYNWIHPRFSLMALRFQKKIHTLLCKLLDIEVTGHSLLALGMEEGEEENDHRRSQSRPLSLNLEKESKKQLLSFSLCSWSKLQKAN